ncbi:checkpoint protein HUS1-like [Thomomys bottae]
MGSGRHLHNVGPDLAHPQPLSHSPNDLSSRNFDDLFQNGTFQKHFPSPEKLKTTRAQLDHTFGRKFSIGWNVWPEVILKSGNITEWDADEPTLGRLGSKPQHSGAWAGAAMRFRAEIVDKASLEHFWGIINMLSDLTKVCTLHICPDKLSFILFGKPECGTVNVWCEMRKENFFSIFEMEGHSVENNEIYVQLNLENVSLAWKSANSAEAMKIKLSNKYSSSLKICVKLRFLSGKSYIVSEYLPIVLITTNFQNKIQELAVPDSKVSIYLPALGIMKKLVKKLKPISNCLIIEANQNGELNLKVESEQMNVTVYFKNLENPPLENGSEDRNPGEMAVVHMDIKQILHLITGIRGNPTTAIVHIVTNRIAYFEFLHNNFSLKYIVPALA